ncbi:hypothetical protein ACFZDC_41185, partial [Streptomyces sp. NPDC007905]
GAGEFLGEPQWECGRLTGLAERGVGAVLGGGAGGNDVAAVGWISRMIAVRTASYAVALMSCCGAVSASAFTAQSSP